MVFQFSPLPSCLPFSPELWTSLPILIWGTELWLPVWRCFAFNSAESLQRLRCLNTDGFFALLHILLVQKAKTSQSITSFLDSLYYLITWWAWPQSKEDLKDIRINAVMDFNFSKGFCEKTKQKCITLFLKESSYHCQGCSFSSYHSSLFTVMIKMIYETFYTETTQKCNEEF